MTDPVLKRLLNESRFQCRRAKLLCRTAECQFTNMRQRHRLPVERGNMTPVTVIIDGKNHEGHAKL